MTNEEAAKRLERLLINLKDQWSNTAEDALIQGAAALRKVEELERINTLWEDQSKAERQYARELATALAAEREKVKIFGETWDNFTSWIANSPMARDTIIGKAVLAQWKKLDPRNMCQRCAEEIEKKEEMKKDTEEISPSGLKGEK